MTAMQQLEFIEKTKVSIIHGDCLEEMRKMESNSISAIVTDPPYGISFMGKGWDHAVPNRTVWAECFRIMVPGSFLLAMGGTRTFHRLTCEVEDAGYEIRDCISWLYGSGFPKSHNHYGIQGYGTALKPAWEPIIMAMKPCDGTFKQSAEKWGQAGINIDECRIGNIVETWPVSRSGGIWIRGDVIKTVNHNKGRWPANVIFDEEAASILGEPSRFFYCAKASSSERNEGLDGLPLQSNMRVNGPRESEEEKFSTKVKNNHPTVKPIKLMEYLIKLVMPPKDGILLDPFAGSGTTILASKRLGFDAIGIEKQAEYVEIARARIS